MIRTSLFVASVLFAGAAAAQQVGPAPAFPRKAEPAAYALVAPDAVAARHFTLAPPDAADFAALRANNAREKRLQIGFARELPAELTALSLDTLAWRQVADGGRVARIEVRSPGAAALRAAIDARALPKGMTLRAYAPDQPRVSHAPARAGERAVLPEQRGDVLGLELYAAAGTDVRGAVLSLASLTHLAVHPLSWDAKNVADIGASGACNIDVACHPDPTWYEVGKAVAKYVFTDAAGDGFLCTGTLLNNLSEDGSPLFVTANHCITSQDEASTMSFYWHFDRATCGGAAPTGSYVAANTTSGGADLLATEAANDMVLLLLNQNPAPDTLLSGWNATEPVRGGDVVGIHHPSGDLKKYAAGTLTAFTDYSSDTHLKSGTHLRIVWNEATTEGGSSGSGLFNDGYQLIGTLEGGAASCDTLTEPDWYGRLDQAYDKFDTWLDPDGGGVPPPDGDPTVTPVNDGETVHADLAEGEWHYYSIELPHDELNRLDTFLTVFSGDADLYVREGAVPTETHYGCRSWESGMSDEACSVTDSTTPGQWYIGVFAWSGPVSYALEVELADATPPPPPADDGGGGHAAWLVLMAVVGWWRHRRRRWTTRSSSFATPNGRR